ncbi:unnamed protein product [Medioppia subpectinata]|uniref:SAM-dependent MTase RsmB/NOP-type domain-containing protein n=1 Tax=Medioppia subpectinata TaxID=1979941 RepID=A0A7R9KYU6_9ACAR|nr:unnamed protein product [Medioppia subpectinata]CAG2112089.1 unnamed protein product [Medioppia subpectinata]
MADASGHKSMPKSYLMASRLLKQMDERKGSLNSLISTINNNKNNIKLIYALIMKTIQNVKIIKQMMKSMSDANDGNDHSIDEFLTQILIADLMFGKKLVGLKDVPQVRHIVSFHDKFTHILKRKPWIGPFKELAINLDENDFLIDYDFQNDLLVFNINATKPLQELRLFNETKIVMQDKASLIAVECLQLMPEMTILDICCAPGMKTTAIASRIQNNGTIVSYDKSEERIHEMETIIETNGVTCCQINCKDFTSVTAEELSSIGTIDAILLDPSCSGSGMNGRVDYRKGGENKGRLYKLASFQTRMLCHAMSLGAKRIVYSTCSLSLIENENVVKSAFRETEAAINYTVVDALPEWPVRGVGDYDFASKCIRSDINTTLTNGFFVCVLERNTKLV